jgi:predicted GNAT family acetyltransferase
MSTKAKLAKLNSTLYLENQDRAGRMYTAARLEHRTAIPQMFAAQDSGLAVSELAAEEEEEVLAFLNERIEHTFGMVGFIRSNGIVSPHNRGTFYGCRNGEGGLEGVAVIGHATMIEARSDAVIAAFARTAQECRDVFMLFGEQEDVQTFWEYYSGQGQQQRLYCRELLSEQRGPVDALDTVPGLRVATIDDLDLVVPVHARTAFEESGVNPLDVDPIGFRQRCARRIEQGKTWVWVENGKLIFKAEIVTDSPDVIYLEGVDVHPDERGKGHGLRCISQLNATLLERTRSVVLLVNVNKKDAQRFYEKAGFKLAGHYDTIFLKQDVH